MYEQNELHSDIVDMLGLLDYPTEGAMHEAASEQVEYGSLSKREYEPGFDAEGELHGVTVQVAYDRDRERHDALSVNAAEALATVLGVFLYGVTWSDAETLAGALSAQLGALFGGLNAAARNDAWLGEEPHGSHGLDRYAMGPITGVTHPEATEAEKSRHSLGGAYRDEIDEGMQAALDLANDPVRAQREVNKQLASERYERAVALACDIANTGRMMVMYVRIGDRRNAAKWTTRLVRISDGMQARQRRSVEACKRTVDDSGRINWGELYLTKAQREFLTKCISSAWEVRKRVKATSKAAR